MTRVFRRAWLPLLVIVAVAGGDVRLTRVVDEVVASVPGLSQFV